MGQTLPTTLAQVTQIKQILLCIPLNYGTQGARWYHLYPFVKAATPLPLITQTGNNAWRPQHLPVSTKNIVMDG